MKILILISTLVCFCFASGGDTIKYTADVKNLKDGDNFYSDIHYHSMKDSIAKIVNGKLGNINIAADAEIDLSKLDTAGSMKFNTLTTDKHTSDTVIADTVKARGLNATNITADSSYFAGGVRGLRLYFPQADIDSTVGNINHGGVSYFRGSTAYGQIKMVPAADSGECMIGFFKDRAGTATTQAWAIGQGGWTTDGFAIGWYSTPILKMYRSGNVKFAGACTTSTLNTGNGDCEVYPTISGTFPCTLKTNDVTVQQIATAYWTKSKDVFTCSIPRIVGTSNSTALRIYCKFPYNPIQLSGSTPDEGCFLLASDNNQAYIAYTEVPEVSGYIQIIKNSGAFTNSGTKGVYAPFTIKYITEN